MAVACRRGLITALLLLAAASLAVAQHAHGTHEEELDEHALEELCEAEELADYDLGLHIGSVFILLGVSLLGSFFPVFLSFFRSKFIVVVIKLGMYFGFGTILATAFIHMLLAANEYLSSPCLTGTWKNYEAWAFMFCVTGIVFMQLIDYCIELVSDSHTSGSAALSAAPSAASHANLSGKGLPTAPSGNNTGFISDAQTTGKDSVASDGVVQDEEAGARYVQNVAANDLELSGHHFLTEVRPSGGDWSQMAGFYFAEAGIVLHSVLIGLALGVTTGSGFTTLLIALSFHQFFEGLAIGAAAVGTGLSKAKCFIVGLVYSLTTPSGIAIGIGVRESWNGNATTTLIVQGVLDSLAAGVLIYVVLVELVTPMMTKSKWMRNQSWLIQLLGIACFWAGAACMSVIGVWA